MTNHLPPGITYDLTDYPTSDNGVISPQTPGPTDQGNARQKVRSESDGRTDNSVSDSSESTPVSPRDMLSARPFVRAAKLWRDAGWMGTIPLPARKKNPPPTGWTGRTAQFPDNEQISEWCRLAQYKRGNIGLHLGWPITINGEEYEVIGVDVDDYEDNGKAKTGGQQLEAIERNLGRLPRTYVSTARASNGDFHSGIRFFLVRRGLAFRGQVDKDIEVIQKNHRFAVVWPSYNPKSDSQYCLYSPDAWANFESGGGIPEPLREIPDVTSLPFLPDKWVDYLTNGKMLDSDQGIDMESTVDEIGQWALDQFNDGDHICGYMRRVVNKWKKKIKDEATSHDKVRDAHWEIINCAAEGHTGWMDALREIDQHWITDVMSRSKRSVSDMNKEMFRSRTNCFRKVKVKVENAQSAGGVYTPPECVCVERSRITAAGGPGGNAGGLFISDAESDNNTDSGGPDDGLANVTWADAKDPDDYELNDDGNGEFLCDLLRYQKSRVKWAEGYGWILWTDSTPDRPARWLRDEDGLIRRAFWRVKRHQEVFASQLESQRDTWVAQAQQTGTPLVPVPAALKAMNSAIKVWREWATKSGNNRQAENAINAAKNFPGVTIDINELNQNPYLLGVANGVVELRTKGAHRRDATASDYVTYNTNVDWHGSYEGLRNDPGYKLWEEYLDRFIPLSRREEFQTILGHCIIGGNPERLILILLGGTSTGKSTMLRAIGAALGDYATTVNLTIFENHKLNPALADAMPKRVVFTSELSANDSLSVATIKRMTGSDAVKAELKGVNVQVTGVPQFVPIMATNAAPEIHGADEALRKRLMVLPFDQRIDDKKDEKRASHDLEEHAKEAILAWLIEGYNLYCKNGIPKNVEIERVTNEFAGQLDTVSEFVAERVRNVVDGRVGVTQLFDAYKAWAVASNVDIRDTSQQKFSRRLTALGYEQKTARVGGKATRAWIGIKLARTGGSSSVEFKMITKSEVEVQEKESNGDNE